MQYQITLQVVVMRGKMAFIAYCPALDLSSCGSSEEKSLGNFAEAARIFFEHCLQNGTLAQVLEECGWERLADSDMKAPANWLPPHILTGARDVAVAV